MDQKLIQDDDELNTSQIEVPGFVHESDGDVDIHVAIDESLAMNDFVDISSSFLPTRFENPNCFGPAYSVAPLLSQTRRLLPRLSGYRNYCCCYCLCSLPDPAG